MPLRIGQEIQAVPRQAELTDAPPRVAVVAGIIKNDDNEVLIADRRRSRTLRDYWEFPGGKLDSDESAEAALRRELEEELGIEMEAARFLIRIEHDYPDLKVGIDFYVVSEWRGQPKGREAQEIRWVAISSLHEANLLPADAPVIDAIRSDR